MNPKPISANASPTTSQTLYEQTMAQSHPASHRQYSAGKEYRINNDGVTVGVWDHFHKRGRMVDAGGLLAESSNGEQLAPASSLLSLTDEELKAAISVRVAYYREPEFSIRLAMPVLNTAAKVARGEAGRVRYYYIEVSEKWGHRLCSVTVVKKGGKAVAEGDHFIATGNYKGDWAEQEVLRKTWNYDEPLAYPDASVPKWAKDYAAKAKAEAAAK